jgi:hypothetical protein
MRLRSGQNSENYRWLRLLLQQDLVATGAMGSEPHKFLKVPIEFNNIGANRSSVTVRSETKRDGQSKGVVEWPLGAAN